MTDHAEDADSEVSGSTGPLGGHTELPAATVVEAAIFEVRPHDVRNRSTSARKTVHAAWLSMRILLSDVVGVMNVLDLGRAHLVGHDWGAALAWNMAIQVPDRVDRLVVLSVPHPAVPLTLEQRERGWYRLFFLLEDTAKGWLRHDDWALFPQFLRDGGDLDRYLADLARPGALSASLNWYRANLAPSPPSPSPQFPRVKVPVLAIWPEGERYLTEERLRHSEQLVDADWRYERIEAAGHWLPLNAPDSLNQLLVTWLVAAP